MAKRSKLSLDEKSLKVMNSLFVLEAAKLGMSGAEMRKILGTGMNEVTPLLKVVNRALKKREKNARKS